MYQNMLRNHFTSCKEIGIFDALLYAKKDNYYLSKTYPQGRSSLLS